MRRLMTLVAVVALLAFCRMVPPAPPAASRRGCAAFSMALTDRRHGRRGCLVGTARQAPAVVEKSGPIAFGAAERRLTQYSAEQFGILEQRIDALANYRPALSPGAATKS